MKKFIKINLIILVIFCLLCNLKIEIFATTNNNEKNDSSIIDESKREELLNLFEISSDVSEIDGVENLDEILEQEKEESSKLDDLQLEKNDLENEIEESNAQIQFIESELTATVAEIAAINQQIVDKQMEIETLEAQEVDLLLYIAKAEEELEKSNKRYNSQKEILEKRLVAMYEMGETSYLDVLLNSTSITDFLSNCYLIEEITKADTELLETVEAEKKYNQKLKEALETKKLVLAASRETREKHAISLANMSSIKNSRLKQLSAEEFALHKMIEEYQNQIAEIETEIRLLALANIGEEYVGGVMAWPVPGYTRITSQFGMRTHPITGVYKLHTGVDIGAPRGSQFIAANDGIVTYAGYNAAYGNMVIIDHGGGITTLYAHGDKILVNLGDSLYQGNPVLEVGSTGYSTGPHAHFEVRINGQYVEPLDYITSYSSSINAPKTEENNKNIVNESAKEGITVEFEENIIQENEILEEEITE